MILNANQNKQEISQGFIDKAYDIINPADENLVIWGYNIAHEIEKRAVELGGSGSAQSLIAIYPLPLTGNLSNLPAVFLTVVSGGYNFVNGDQKIYYARQMLYVASGLEDLVKDYQNNPTAEKEKKLRDICRKLGSALGWEA